VNNSQNPTPDIPNIEKSQPSLELSKEETKAVVGSQVVDSGFWFEPPIEPNEVGVLGPYRIISELGRGGMGAVYAAIDTRLDRKIAIKVMLPQYAANASAKERFLREARAAAKVKHIHVVTIYEADERKGIPYIAMEFLEGYPLDQYLTRKGSPSLKQIVRIVSETLSGLGAAHKLGLIHRDIKPGNLWLEAPNGLVKVLDFGLAKPIDSEVELTKSGVIVGTPAYMSTEQAEGAKLDARADLYSVGVVMYRLCTGRLPFEGPNTIAVLMAIANKEPIPVRELNPSVPESFAQLIHQLLAKSADQRPQSAGEVITRLKAIANELDGKTLSPEAIPEPHVVSLAVTAIPDADPFANIDADSVTQIESSPKPAQPKAITKKKKPIGLLILATCSLLLLVILAGVILILTQNKENPQAKGNPSDLTQNTKIDNGTRSAPKVTPIENTKSLPPKKTSIEEIGKNANDPDRKAAEWALKIGAVMVIKKADEQPQTFRKPDLLPNEPFVLTELRIASTERINNDDLQLMQGCNHLRVVNFNSINVNDAGIANFKHCKNLEDLSIFQTEVTEKGFETFKDMEKLRLLTISGKEITDQALSNFQKAKLLTRIDIRDSDISDKGLSYFQGCANLKELQLVNCEKVTDKGLNNFKGATLHNLTLQNIAITDVGLTNFTNHQNLLSLALSSVNITNVGLENFKGCETLLQLNLWKTKVTDEGLSNFKDCKQLNNVNLGYAEVTNKAISHLKNCLKLRSLNLLETKVTDEVLEQLKDFNELDVLDLQKTSITFKAAQEFQKTNPKCQINHNEGQLQPKK